MNAFKDQTGAPVLPTVDEDSAIPVTSKYLKDIQETNRLLRQLIALTELIWKQDAPEVE